MLRVIFSSSSPPPIACRTALPSGPRVATPPPAYGIHLALIGFAGPSVGSSEKSFSQNLRDWLHPARVPPDPTGLGGLPRPKWSALTTGHAGTSHPAGTSCAGSLARNVGNLGGIRPAQGCCAPPGHSTVLTDKPRQVPIVFPSHHLPSDRTHGHSYNHTIMQPMSTGLRSVRFQEPTGPSAWEITLSPHDWAAVLCNTGPCMRPAAETARARARNFMDDMLSLSNRMENKPPLSPPNIFFLSSARESVRGVPPSQMKQRR